MRTPDRTPDETLLGKRVRVARGDAIGTHGVVLEYELSEHEHQSVVYRIRFDLPVYMSASASQVGGLWMTRDGFTLEGSAEGRITLVTKEQEQEGGDTRA